MLMVFCFTLQHSQQKRSLDNVMVTEMGQIDKLLLHSPNALMMYAAGESIDRTG
jgi:hypothetical protein